LLRGGETCAVRRACQVVMCVVVSTSYAAGTLEEPVRFTSS
jgi:hypothetical protein